MTVHTLLLRTILAAAAAGAMAPASAFQFSITAGARTLYLQVGSGTMTGGNFNAGGTPGSNATINVVEAQVPGSALGSGTAVAMPPTVAVTTSPYNGNTVCTTQQLYIGGFFRRPGGGLGGQTAVLSVTAPAGDILTSGSGATIPITAISWTSSDTASIPSASFTGGSQNLLSLGRNTWFESCLTFQYANSAVFPAGTFTGRATYTLTAP